MKKRDIDQAMAGWDVKPGFVQARIVEATDGRKVLQMRVDLGVLQMELENRPDGTHPHGCDTYFEYLKKQAANRRPKARDFVLNPEQCVEADREFHQFYQRRLCWLSLHEFDRAVRDADHNLAFMDFVKEHSPDEEYTAAHEQYRAFVLFHRSQAAAGHALEQNNPEQAIDELREGIRKIEDFFEENGYEDTGEEPMLQQLRTMIDQIRELHSVGDTLSEQLKLAIQNEDYETAARLRDQLKKRVVKDG
jgi:hypothetical protein